MIAHKKYLIFFIASLLFSSNVNANEAIQSNVACDKNEEDVIHTIDTSKWHKRECFCLVFLMVFICP